jgi:hypothetical protein
VGEIDGIPKNWDALIAEVEEAHNPRNGSWRIRG